MVNEQQAAAAAPVRERPSLIILDNISTLVRSGKENEAESWLPVQTDEGSYGTGSEAHDERPRGRAALFRPRAQCELCRRGSR
jgi:hypothetical protein